MIKPSENGLEITCHRAPYPQQHSMYNHISCWHLSYFTKLQYCVSNGLSEASEFTFKVILQPQNITDTSFMKCWLTNKDILADGTFGWGFFFLPLKHTEKRDILRLLVQRHHSNLWFFCLVLKSQDKRYSLDFNMNFTQKYF